MHRHFARLFLAALPLFLALPSRGAGPLVVLRPHHPTPGETIRITTTTTARNGAITVREGANQRTGTIEISRKRIIDQRLAGTGAKQKLTFRVLSDDISTTTRLAGSPPETKLKSGPLSGLTATGMRDATKRWKFFLADTATDTARTTALAALEAYANRRWFPPRAVPVGTTWPIDPGFIRHIVARDLGKTPLEATMTLREVRKDPENPNAPGIAVLDCKIATRGHQKENAARPESGAIVSLAGTLEIDLATMLDQHLLLEGTLTTFASKDGTTTTVHLPVRMEATKKIVAKTP
jgi:hypothetical protein